MAARSTYHHGDLRAALVSCGVEAARQGGVAAVRLTQVAERAGVTAAAAYRHFPDGLDGLLAAVGDVGRRELAERIVLRTGQVRGSRDPAVLARRRFYASGQAYVEYVTEQPGLFQVSTRHDREAAPDADPKRLLAQCLDDLVASGALPASRRPHATVAAWAAVHGLAVLLTETSLARLPDAEREAVVRRTLDMVQAGL